MATLSWPLHHKPCLDSLGGRKISLAAFILVSVSKPWTNQCGGPSSSLLMVCSGPCYMFCCSSGLSPLGVSRALWFSLDITVTARMAGCFMADG